MAMKKKPVTGMKDITPREMEIRDYVIRMIKDTYGTFDFLPLRHLAWSTSRTSPASREEKTKTDL